MLSTRGGEDADRRGGEGDDRRGGCVGFDCAGR